MSNTKKIGERLKRARLNAGYATIEQFVKDKKIPRTTYTQYEAGTRSMSISRISEISSMLKTNMLWIITGYGSQDISDKDLILSITNSEKIDIKKKKSCQLMNLFL